MNKTGEGMKISSHSIQSGGDVFALAAVAITINPSVENRCYVSILTGSEKKVALFALHPFYRMT